MLRSRLMGFRLPRRSLFAGGLMALACYSPTLPLPPPGKPDVSAVEGNPGYYRLLGQVEPDGEVIARNTETALLNGQITEADGRYDFVVQGEPFDQMELWYVVGKEASPRVLFVLPELESGAGGAGGAPP